MSEFEHNGQLYRIARLNAKTQWGLNRRLAPLIPPLIPVFVRISKAGGLANDLAGVAELLGPFTEGLAGMNEEAFNWVIDTCLSAVTREVKGQWARIWISSSGISQFDELNDIGNQLPIVIKVIADALGPFYLGLVTAQQTEVTAAE